MNTMAKIILLTHVDFEGPGRIADWARARGHTLSQVNLGAGEALPKPESVAALVVMGGPMSVHDEKDHPWLAPEKKLVRDTIAAGKPVLGICLGAQIIASATGGRVVRNPAGREIGWWPLHVAHRDSRFPISDGLTAFHWHGEMCEPPPQAVVIAGSAACPVQAFRIGEKALALQCHMETDAASLEAIISGCAGELGAGQEHVQSAAALTHGLRQAGPMHAWLERTLDAWIAD